MKSNYVQQQQAHPMIQAIIFDLDGTLLDTESLSDYAMYAALSTSSSSSSSSSISSSQNDNTNETIADNHHQRLLPWELKRQILGLRSSDWGPIVLSYANTVWGIPNDVLPTVDELAMNWEKQLSDYCYNVQACIGAYTLVEQFAIIGLPMAIATSSRQSAVDKKRTNHTTMFQHIPIIVCGDHPAIQNGKPHPDIYLEAARQLNVLPHNCLVFEDALSGIRSAKSAGCYVVAVPDRRFDENEMIQFQNEADVVIPDLWHFQGKQFGIELDMILLKPNV